ncbi:hypothetical protein E2L08_06690 [Palleronia sediminis]|uniref:Uncharacterized protein n=1 Tax=Palleronia sediminis TaxID=2547833 RepID=A0A4V3BA14_9RHOB|nr:sugar phosphate nucleotidyltransferase [Palleronia sediminis]TDL81349.1 hypothetical protein E2L08_06690 [Palleronia sediminis]
MPHSCNLAAPVPATSAAAGTRVAAIVLAGGRGTRLHELTDTLCKPAVPFLGENRIIDFTMGNLCRSGFGAATVATQYRAAPLHGHLRRTWSDRIALRLRHGPTVTGRREGSRGTADAVRILMDEIDASGARELLVLAADHVYRMDYRDLIADHRRRHASVTVAVDLVPRATASAFGVLAADPGGRISRFVEKPANPPGCAGDPSRSMVSMGLYVFDWAWLRAHLAQVPEALDFGHDILPVAVTEGRAIVHAPGRARPFYWRDVGTLDGLLDAALDFASDTPPFPLPRPLRPAQMRLRDRHHGIVDSLLMPRTMVSEGALLSRCIVAPGSVLPFGTRIGVDAGRDAQFYRCSGRGTVLVTPEMIRDAAPRAGARA